MAKSETVKVLREHANEFGESYVKVEGTEYQLPTANADKLASFDLVKVLNNENNDDLQRGQGTGKGAGAAGKGGDAQNGGEKGIEGSS